MAFSLDLPTPIPNIPEHTTTPLYLILDGGQIDDLEKTLLSQGFQIQVVCPVPLLPLRSASPFITRLTPESLQWFIGYNKANHGYIVQSPLDERELAEKLQDYYQVITPYGSEIFFKIGQPEIMQVLLSNDHTPLWDEVLQVWLPTRLGWQHLTKDTEVQTHPLSKEGYKLNEPQWKMIGEEVERSILVSLHQYLTTHFPNYLKGNPAPYAFLKEKMDEATHFGIESECDLKLYLNIFAMLGETVLTTETYPEIRHLIEKTSTETASQRIENAENLALTHYSQIDLV